MHAFPPEQNEDELYLSGTARTVTDDVLLRDAEARFLAERSLRSPPPGFDARELFAFRIERCLHTVTTGNGDWNPRNVVWRADAPRGSG